MTTIRLIYIGARAPLLGAPRISHHYRVEGENRELVFTTPFGKNPEIGRFYTVQTVDRKTFRLVTDPKSPAEYIPARDNAADLRAWHDEDRSARTRARSYRDQGKRRTIIKKAMAPVRELYQAAGPAGRDEIIRLVIAALAGEG